MATLADLLLGTVTGRTRQKLQDDVAMGRGPLALEPDAANLDKAVHALATQGMAERLGEWPALGIGYGREIAQGVGQVVQGEPFTGVNGYDPADIEANLIGIRAAGEAPPPVRPGFGLQGSSIQPAGGEGSTIQAMLASMMTERPRR